MKTLNPKKHRKDRRKRPKKSLVTRKVIYKEIETKSRAGIKYKHYKPIVVPK